MYRTRRSRSHVPAGRNQGNEPGCATGGFVCPVACWGEGGSAGWDTVAGRRGHGKGRGSGESMSQGQLADIAWGALTTPSCGRPASGGVSDPPHSSDSTAPVQ